MCVCDKGLGPKVFANAFSHTAYMNVYVRLLQSYKYILTQVFGMNTCPAAFTESI